MAHRELSLAHAGGFSRTAAFAGSSHDIGCPVASAGVGRAERPEGIEAFETAAAG
jgi:hypothetical protein